MEDNTNLNNTQSPNINNPMGNNTNSYVPLQNNGQMGSGSLNNPNSSQQGSQPYNPYQQNVGYQQNPYSQYNNYYSQTPQSNQYQQTQIPQWNNWGQPGVQQNQFQQNPGMNINPYQQQLPQMYTQQNLEGKKYCKHCGAIIDKDCVICPSCGKQIEELRNSQPNIVINNSNHN